MEVDCSHALLLVPEYEPLRDVGPGAEYGIRAWLLMSYHCISPVPISF